MKILHISPIEKAGGVSNHTLKLTNELRKKNYDAEIFNTSVSENFLIFKDIFSVFKRTFILAFFLIFNYKKYDVIHVQSSGPFFGFLTSIITCTLKKIFHYKLIITYHYSKTEQFLDENRLIFNYIIDICDFFIVVSEKQRLYINIKYKYKYDNKMEVITNGYDDEFVNKINKQNISTIINSDYYKIINISNLIESKGHKYLIESIYILKNKYKISKIMCYIVGRGPLYNDLSILIKKMDLSENVILTGWLSLEDMGKLLFISNLFVLPSLAEGNPTVMFEALGFGLPFIGTNVGGISEIITSDKFGFIVEKQNSEELAKAIYKTIETKWSKREIIKYSKKFTWKNIANQTIEIYKKILKTHA